MMKRRYIYSILFGVPGLLIAAIISAMLAGMTLGVLWLFVFGDNPWPAWTETLLLVLLGIIFLAAWGGCWAAGYFVGRRREADASLNKGHVFASVGLTLAMVFFLLLYEFSVGNFGPKSDSTLCSDYCTSKGYAASSMPPRNSGDRSCSCLDATGHAIITVPVDSLGAGK